MNKKHYYQLVRTPGKYDYDYTVYEARVDVEGTIEIAAIPFILVGNHASEIMDTIKLIAKDIKKYPIVDKKDCNIFHEDLIYSDTDYLLDDSFDDENPAHFGLIVEKDDDEF